MKEKRASHHLDTPTARGGETVTKYMGLLRTQISRLALKVGCYRSQQSGTYRSSKSRSEIYIECITKTPGAPASPC